MVSENLKIEILELIDILIKFSTSSYDDKDIIEYGHNILCNMYCTSIPIGIPILYKKIRILTISRLINITLEPKPGEIDIGRTNDRMYHKLLDDLLSYENYNIEMLIKFKSDVTRLL